MALAHVPVLAAESRIQPSGRYAVNVLRSEWTKIRSVRSTYWTLICAAVLTVGLSAIVCAVYVAQFSELKSEDLQAFDAAATSLTGGILAQFAIAVFGVIVITGEYSTGVIRTTFAAVPRRLHVLAAKLATFSALTFAVTALACFVAFFIGQAILSARGLGVSVTDPNVVRTVIGTALYLTILGVLALGIGVLVRKTAGAITAMVGILFVLPVLAGFLPSSLESIQQYLPSNAGTAIINSGPERAETAAQLGPWMGLAVFFGYAVATLGAGGYLLRRRDA